MTNIMPVSVNEQKLYLLMGVMAVGVLVFAIGLTKTLHLQRNDDETAEEHEKITKIGLLFVLIGGLAASTGFVLFTSAMALPIDQIEQYYNVSDFETKTTGIFGGSSYNSNDINKNDYTIRDVRFTDSKNNVREGQLIVKQNEVVLNVKSGNQYKPYNVVKK